MTIQNEKDAAMRFACRIVELQRDYCEELEKSGQTKIDAILNSHTPLFAVINSARTTIKQSFDADVLEYFDGMIDRVKIDHEAH